MSFFESRPDPSVLDRRWPFRAFRLATPDGVMPFFLSIIWGRKKSNKRTQIAEILQRSAISSYKLVYFFVNDSFFEKYVRFCCSKKDVN